MEDHLCPVDSVVGFLEIQGRAKAQKSKGQDSCSDQTGQGVGVYIKRGEQWLNFVNAHELVRQFDTSLSSQRTIAVTSE